ncbi:hypothetical protein AAT19DRAFT_12501 [Rhodotorula toruloides]|uniref:Uncharacterized protein n=1 Tax=Rhodotorula toruloides TaxID=5286 RepID=A0A2T0AGF0_RHOTO|nr:hypothetical protein AAT19DRAFT_12501 [Rhodotorula toruloides]
MPRSHASRIAPRRRTPRLRRPDSDGSRSSRRRCAGLAVRSNPRLSLYEPADRVSSLQSRWIPRDSGTSTCSARLAVVSLSEVTCYQRGSNEAGSPFVRAAAFGSAHNRAPSLRGPASICSRRRRDFKSYLSGPGSLPLLFPTIRRDTSARNLTLPSPHAVLAITTSSDSLQKPTQLARPARSH